MSFEGVYCFFSGIFYNDLNIDNISHPFNYLSVVYRTIICFIYNAFFFILEKHFSNVFSVPVIIVDLYSLELSSLLSAIKKDTLYSLS